MTIPIHYRGREERILTNFSVFDIISGKGYIRLYLLDNDGPLYGLTSLQMFGDDGFVKWVNGGSIDVDFDLEIGNSFEIDGDAFVNVSMVIHNGDASPQTISTTITAKIRRWDGSTETEIASDSEVVTADTLAANNYFDRVVAFKIPVTKTKFKKGETIRVTITGTDPAIGNASVWIGSDPFSRSAIGPATKWDAKAGAQSTILLPTRIQL